MNHGSVEYYNNPLYKRMKSLFSQDILLKRKRVAIQCYSALI